MKKFLLFFVSVFLFCSSLISAPLYYTSSTKTFNDDLIFNRTLTGLDEINFSSEFGDDTYANIIDDNLLGYGVKGSVNIGSNLVGDSLFTGVFDLTPFTGSYTAGSYYMDADGGQASFQTTKQQVRLNANDGSTWSSIFKLADGSSLDLTGANNYFDIITDIDTFRFELGTLKLPASTSDYAPLKFTAGVDVTVLNKGELWFNGTDLNFYDGSTTHNLLSGGVGYYVWDNTDNFTDFLLNSGILDDLDINSEVIDVYMKNGTGVNVWNFDYSSSGTNVLRKIRLIGSTSMTGDTQMRIAPSVQSNSFFEQMKNLTVISTSSAYTPITLVDSYSAQYDNVILYADNDNDDALPIFQINAGDVSFKGDFSFLFMDNVIVNIDDGYTGSLDFLLDTGTIEGGTISGGYGTTTSATVQTQPYNYAIAMLYYKTTPSTGTFDISWNGNGVTGLAYNIDASTLQVQLRSITGLEDVVVQGTSNGWNILMINVDIPVAQFVIVDNTDGILVSGQQQSGNWEQIVIWANAAFINGGTYDITIPGNYSTFNWNDPNSVIQTSLRTLTGVTGLTVAGNLVSGMTIRLIGYHGDQAISADLTNIIAFPSTLILTAHNANANISLKHVGYLGNIRQVESGKAYNLEMNAYKSFTAIEDVELTNKSTEESLIDAAGIGSNTILAKTLKVGDVIRIKVTGLITTTGTPDETIKIYMGGTVIVTSSATLPTLTGSYFEFDVDITVRTITTLTETGSVYVSGKTFVQNLTGFSGPSGRGIYTATDIEVDTSVDNILDATYQFSVADPDNSILVRSFIIERL